MGRPNPRHGRGRGRLKAKPQKSRRVKQKTKRDTELTVTPWFPEDEEEDYPIIKQHPTTCHWLTLVAGFFLLGYVARLARR